MFVSYSPPCSSGNKKKKVNKLLLLSFHVNLLKGTDLEKTKTELFITLCNPKFCSKVLEVCIVSKLCLHFCALHQILAQPGSFEIRQTETLEKNSSTVLAMQNNKIETVRTDMSLYDMLTISSLFYFAKVPSL